jgi:uncharacterized protein YyaL (SSP411 family)
LQHADNPVDWWEWGEPCFAEARARDLPILLSVGYAACHWCHVMAHESFEDPTIAAAMNADFVNVKVDREERPDVDAVYMKALIGLTGHGGWPMTLFLTADGRPFYAGTYFPPRPRHGLASFPQLLTAVAETWRDRRDEVEAAATGIAGQLSQAVAAAAPSGGAVPDPAALDGAVTRLVAEFDHAHGGFGGAPKFPPSMLLEFLIRHHARSGDPRSVGMAQETWQAMARGGIYDQLDGGFARYSVDAGWVVPHFEKMLYDNALLARVYLHGWRLTGDPLARRVAEQTLDFLISRLRTADGGFASSLDADSADADGDAVAREGACYVWTREQLIDVLGVADGDFAADLLGVSRAGTFERGASVLQLRADPDDAARWERVRDRLRLARDARPQPTRDDKVVTGWNGLAIAALAEGSVLLDRPDLLTAALAAERLIRQVHQRDGRLRRSSRDGQAGVPMAVLEDYAYLADGLLALLAADSDGDRLVWLGSLLDDAVALFGDGSGGFYESAAPDLLHRPRDPDDGATPAAWTVLAGALLGHAALTGSAEGRTAAEQALAVVGPLAAAAPRSAGWGLAVAEAWWDGPREVAVVGEPGPELEELRRAALRGTAPGLVLAAGRPDQAGLPLLADRPTTPRPVGYVCRGFVCAAPVADAGALSALVSGHG